MVDESPQLEVTQCPSWAAALGYMGVAAAVCLSNWGSAVREDGYRRDLYFVAVLLGGTHLMPVLLKPALSLSHILSFAHRWVHGNLASVLCIPEFDIHRRS